jgi:hypothetical protein
MRFPNFFFNAIRLGLVACAIFGTSILLAKEGGAAHVHGLVKLNVAIDGSKVSVLLDAPLDSLLSFEHRPRTPAQQQAADALLKQLTNVSELIRPQAQAVCKSSSVTINSEVLQSKTNAAKKDTGHADLEATFEFICDKVDKLASIEIGLFDAFKRIQKIQVQAAGLKGQSKQLMKRPDKLLRMQ